jgi:hypothetical protein
LPKQKYSDLDDITKLNKQWRKMSGLHGREEWSAAIVRAATAAEIAANYAIRQEFKARSKFDAKFVDSMLRWANGIDGKITKLLIPIHADGKNAVLVSGLKTATDRLNRDRNLIVHSGHFMNETEAEPLIAEAKDFIHALVRIYDPTYTLKDHATTAKTKVKKLPS